MSETDELVFETSLDASPEKVWRALSIEEYRNRWLDVDASVKVDVVSAEANSLLTLRWSETTPGLADSPQFSTVTFELAPDDSGGTLFRLTHRPIRIPAAANGNNPVRMQLRAA